MLPQPMIRDWAQRLIAAEVDADGPSAQTERGCERGCERVYEKLRTKLCAPVGVDGFQALAARALSLARSQSPGLSAVHITANGSLRGFDELQLKLGEDEVGEVGIILIAQLLRLLLTLLGEAATVRLVADVPLRVEVEAEVKTMGESASTPNPNYFGPFEGILSEAAQLRTVSDRLETLADEHVGIDEMMNVAGNIRHIAAVLDVFTMIRSKAGGSQKGVLSAPPNGYLN